MDCGAAPGSWSQVAVELSSPDGTVVSIDLLDFEPVPGAVYMPRIDIRQTQHAVKSVRTALGADRCVDVVLSDIAPSASGLAHLDHPGLIQLAQSVLHVSTRNHHHLSIHFLSAFFLNFIKDQS